MRKRDTSIIVKVGIFIIAALSVMIGFIFTIGDSDNLFGNNEEYKIYFESTGGLFEGDQVLLNGVEVGNVKHIGFPEDVKNKKIIVKISVKKEIANRIREDTRARIVAASLVYGKVVELSMGSNSFPVIKPGKLIKTQISSNFTTVIDSTKLMVGDIRTVLSRLKRSDGVFGKLLNEPMDIQQTMRNLAHTSRYLASILKKMDDDKSAIGAILSDSVDFKKTIENFNSAVSDFRKMTNNLVEKRSAAGRLLNDEEYGKKLMDDLYSAVHSISSITAKIDTGKGTLGGLVNDPEVYLGLRDVILGVERSSLMKWIIKGRKEAGEKERKKIEENNNRS